MHSSFFSRLAATLTAIALPFSALAATTDLQSDINNLAAQLNQVENTVANVNVSASPANEGTGGTSADVVALTRPLGRGANGSDVKALQDALGDVAGVYPEALTTGYYGDLTERAVKRFQKAFAIPQTGTVGDLTRAQVAELTKLPGRVAVHAEGNEAAVTAVIKTYGGTVLTTNPATGVLIAEIPRAVRPDALAQLQAIVGVRLAERDALALPEWGATPPNDPNYPNEWHIPKIGDDQAQALSTGKGVSVAICDSGVDATHPDLAPNLTAGWNTASNNTDTSPIYTHGTKVAGVVGAVANNGIGVAGVASEVKIVPVRVTNFTDGSAYTSNIAACFTWAADHGIRVANASYGYIDGSYTIQSAAQYMFNKNGVVVIAEGNTGTNSGYSEVPQILAVSATDPNDAITSWSTYGNDVDLSAPGSGIWTTTVGGGYAAVSGTSFSSPIVAGVAALVMAKNPALTASQVQSILKTTAVDLGTPGYDIYYGAGRVNALAAVQAAGGIKPTTDTIPPSTPTALVASSVASMNATLSWVASTDNVGVVGYSVYRNNVRVATVSGARYVDANLAPSTAYTYAVSAYDAAGNESARSASISITTLAAVNPDTTPPSVPTSLTASTITSSSVALKWNASTDNIGVVGYHVYRNNVRIATTSLASAVGSITGYTDSTLAPNTTYVYAVSAYDAAGNESAPSSSVSATTLPLPDTVAPSVPTGLVTTALSSSSVALKWNASTDNIGVVGYHVYRNNVRIATTTATPIASPTIYTDTAVSSSAAYTYTVTAFDAAGNESGQATPLTVYVPAPKDTTPPSASFSTPTAGATVSGTVGVLISATDNVGVGTVILDVNGTFVGAKNVAPYTFTWDSTKMPNGTAVLAAYVSDTAGNQTIVSLPVAVRNIVPDTTPPSVSITGPLPGTTVSGTVPVTVSAHDNVGVTAVILDTNGAFIGIAGGGSGMACALVCTFNWDSTKASNGAVTLLAIAYDGAGNKATASISVIVNNSSPVTIPTPVPTPTPAPTPTPIVSTLPTPTGLTVVNAAATYSSAGWTAVTWNSASAATPVKGYKVYRNGTLVFTTLLANYNDHTVQPNTTYTYMVTAFDYAGNESAKSAPVTITTPASTGTVQITNLTVNPQYVGNAIMYRAKVTSTNGLKGVYMLRDVVNGLFATRTAMIPSATQPGTYELLVPAQTSAATIPYAIYGVDGAGTNVVSPAYSLTIATASATPTNLAASAGDVDLTPILEHVLSVLQYVQTKLSALGQ